MISNESLKELREFARELEDSYPEPNFTSVSERTWGTLVLQSGYISYDGVTTPEKLGELVDIYTKAIEARRLKPNITLEQLKKNELKDYKVYPCLHSQTPPLVATPAAEQQAVQVPTAETPISTRRLFVGSVLAAFGGSLLLFGFSDYGFYTDRNKRKAAIAALKKFPRQNLAKVAQANQTIDQFQRQAAQPGLDNTLSQNQAPVSADAVIVALKVKADDKAYTYEEERIIKEEGLDTRESIDTAAMAAGVGSVIGGAALAAGPNLLAFRKSTQQALSADKDTPVAITPESNVNQSRTEKDSTSANGNQGEPQTNNSPDSYPPINQAELTTFQNLVREDMLQHLDEYGRVIDNRVYVGKGTADRLDLLIHGQATDKFMGRKVDPNAPIYIEPVNFRQRQGAFDGKLFRPRYTFPSKAGEVPSISVVFMDGEQKLEVPLVRILYEVEKMESQSPYMHLLNDEWEKYFRVSRLRKSLISTLPQTPDVKREPDIEADIPPVGESGLRVLKYTKEEARNLNHNFIGAEHLLLGVLREAPDIFEAVGLDVNEIRRGIESIVGKGSSPSNEWMTGPTPRAENVLRFALEEAKRHQQDKIETPHILIGLMRENEGFASAILESRMNTSHIPKDVLLREAQRRIEEEQASGK